MIYNLSSSDLRLGVQIECQAWTWNNSTIDQYFTIEVYRDNILNDSGQILKVGDWDEDFYSQGFSQDRADFIHWLYGPIKCINKDQDMSVGIYERNNAVLDINLRISGWINYTDGVVWKPYEQIIDKSQNLKVVFYMKSKYFDFTDISNPIKFFMRKEEAYLSTDLTKFAWITLK